VALRWKSEAKEAKSNVDQMMRRVVQTQERLAQLLEPQEQAKAQPEPEKPIRAEDDVFGYLAQMAKRFETLEQRLMSANKQTTEKLETTELRDGFVKDAQRFAAKEPAFAQAYQHVISTLHKELAAEGLDDEGERNKMIAENIRDRATRLLRAGKSPAEAIWAIAQARGFQATPAVDPNIAKEASAKAELDRINRTKAATQSLNGAGGGGLGEGLTLQKLANLAGDDYSNARRSYISKHGETAWRNLIGGG
jgi:vacuolar-type H+-ATPase subunit I/STV1